MCLRKPLLQSWCDLKNERCHSHMPSQEPLIFFLPFQVCAEPLRSPARDRLQQSVKQIRLVPVSPYGRRQWHPTPVLLPGKSHGWRSLVGCSPWVAKGRTRLSNFTFTFHFHALEKAMATHSTVLAWRIPGTGAWWATIYGVTQNWTRLTWLSSSSSVSLQCSKTSVFLSSPKKRGYGKPTLM